MNPSLPSEVQMGQLRRLVPLNRLPTPAFERLVKQLPIETAVRGQLLFREGDIDHHHIYLLSGSVSLLSGKEVVESINASSDTARYPLAHQFPRRFSGRVEAAVTLVRIDTWLLNDLLAGYLSEEDYRVDEVQNSASDWMSQLLQSRVFQMIPAANIQGAMLRMQQLVVEKDELIFRQGDPGDFYYVINQGTCCLTRTATPGGQDTEVARLGSGTSFGEDALISGNPRNCSVRMLTDGILLRLSKKDFLELVKRPLSRVVSYAEAKQQVDGGAIWLDVRPQDEYNQAHLPGAINLPFYLLRYQASSLDPDRHYIAYCEDESTSTAAGFLLTERGISVAVLSGGLNRVRGFQRELVPPQPLPPASAPTQSDNPPPPLTAETPVADVESKLLAAKENFDRLQRQYLMERRQWSQALAAARSRPDNRDFRPRNNGDADQWQRTLKQAEMRITQLTEALRDAEERYQEEGNEMQRLWEKRVAQLEAEINRLTLQNTSLRRELDEARKARGALGGN